MSLRQRHISVPSEGKNQIEQWIESEPVQKLKRFDIYPKTREHVTEHTTLGIILSIITIIIALILIFNEVQIYLTPFRKDSLGVDMNPEGKIDIIFNITFPHIKCELLHVDVIDASGEQQIDIFHRVHKTAVNDAGNLIGDGRQAGIQATPYSPFSDPRSPFYCGSCYRAHQRDGQCCNTCGEVLRQYDVLGLPKPNMNEITQCQEEISHMHPGCNMYAALRVQKVSGNFHFAPGRSYSHEHDVNVHHIHEFNPFLIRSYNTSHIIHQMSFGPRAPDLMYPLDNTVEYVNGIAIHKYFIKVVPTFLRGTFSWFGDFETYQYSYTTFVQEIDLRRQMALPGVFFVYEPTPITITYESDGPSLLHLLVKLCAVIGGLYTVSKGINSILNVIFYRKK
jgi:hypothetical protein